MPRKPNKKKRTENCPICGKLMLKKAWGTDKMVYECQGSKPTVHSIAGWKKLRSGEIA